MAGFQKFPVPRHILTRAYWAYAPRGTANAVAWGVSASIFAFAFMRYSLIRKVVGLKISVSKSWVWFLPFLRTRQCPTASNFLISRTNNYIQSFPSTSQIIKYQISWHKRQGCSLLTLFSLFFLPFPIG